MKYCINKKVNQVWFKWNPLCKCLIYGVTFIKFSFTILIKEVFFNQNECELKKI